MFKWIRRIFLVLLGGVAFWLLLEFITFPSISKLRTENPESTSMIDTRIAEAQARGEQPKRVQMWVNLDKISPFLQRAVLAGEDTNFATHNGFDFDAIQKAWEAGKKETEKEAQKDGDNDPGWLPDMSAFKRGGSTISQQLVKNLYLSSERSFIRKAREAAITYFMEKELTKPRILELYLNVIEWGDGIYGAEAASQYYFNKHASELSQQEAAFLSAVIPSPLRVFNPKLNPKRVARRQRIILRGMPFVKMPAGTGP
ncbi:MAG: transglycosylase domain-containing protein [Pyrinomonadaceae bacterium]